MTRELPKRTYGKTGVQMPILALGGAGVLQDASRTAEAVAIIREAVEQGVYYLDTAQQYRDSERIFGEAIEGHSPQSLSQHQERTARLRRAHGATSKTASKRLRTDRLEQWIVHHVSYPHEIDRLFAPDGAMKAFQQAKRAEDCAVCRRLWAQRPAGNPNSDGAVPVRYGVDPAEPDGAAPPAHLREGVSGVRAAQGGRAGGHESDGRWAAGGRR
jgi:hypothetical protein